jgi:hypothetical protein
VPHGVRAQLSDTSLCCSMLKRLPNPRVQHRQRTKLYRRCEDPIFLSGELCRLLPQFQDLQQFTDSVFCGIRFRTCEPSLWLGGRSGTWPEPGSWEV